MESSKAAMRCCVCRRTCSAQGAQHPLLCWRKSKGGKGRPCRVFASGCLLHLSTIILLRRPFPRYHPLPRVGHRFTHSVRLSSGLVAEIDACMLRQIFFESSKASTRTMNAFGLWMEHTLPPHVASKIRIIDSIWFGMVHSARTKSHTSKTLDGLFGEVDASKLMFVFFPLLHRAHWSLFVLYVHKNGRIPGLIGKKSHLLFFDSMGLTNPFECMDEMEGALMTLSKAASDPNVSQDLGSPSQELTFEQKPAPQ